MGESRVIYNNFSGGEYGHPGGANAPDNSFTSRNMIVYRSGLFGPRPGIKASVLSSAGGIIANMWRGVSDGSAADADVWYVTASGAVYFKARTASGGYSFNAGSLAGSVSLTRPPQAIHVGLGQYVLTNPGDQSYIVNLTQMGGGTDTPLVAISGSEGCSAIGVYGDRVFIANNGTVGGFRRVYYTDPADISSFPIENFFDVPSNSGVAALVGQRDSLAILMEDGSWWTFRGAGTSASLRKATSAEWPDWNLNQNAVCKLANDEIVEMSPLGDWPVTFDGVNLYHQYLAGPAGDSVPFGDAADIKVLVGRRPHEAAIILPDTTNGARLYLNRDGIWTIHILPTNISAAASSTGTGSLLLTNNASPHVFYEFDLSLDRPAFASDTYARPGDLSDTPVDARFTLPEWWSEPGTEVRVRQVIVDFLKYQTGATGNDCGFSLSVTIFGMFENDGVANPTTQSYSESGADASTSGVRDRKVFNIGEQGYGAGFQVGLNLVKGVAIKSITVVLDTEQSIPRN